MYTRRVAAAAAAEAAKAAAQPPLPVQALPPPDAATVALACGYLEAGSQDIDASQLAAVLEGMRGILSNVPARKSVAAFEDAAKHAYASPPLKLAARHLADALPLPAILAEPSMAAKALHALGQLGVWPRQLVAATAGAAIAPGTLDSAPSGSLRLLAKGLAMLQAAHDQMCLLVVTLAQRCQDRAAPPVSAHDAIGAAWAACIADADELAPEVVLLCLYAAYVLGPDGCAHLEDDCKELCEEVRLAGSRPRPVE